MKEMEHHEVFKQTQPKIQGIFYILTENKLLINLEYK